TVHVVHAVGGPITSVAVERQVERAGIDGVRAGRVAAVGVGPVGVQQLVLVIETPGARDGLATDQLAQAVRAAVGEPVAAVLTQRALPVDIRHNAKIGRPELARFAARKLSRSRR
ncbi:MAG: hydrolase, partial [Myxococcota bacterium]|nr:hydrolase [Myxococcota bacterium]